MILFLDDDADFLPEQMSFLVQTSWQTGLTTEDVDEVLRLVKK